MFKAYKTLRFPELMVAVMSIDGVSAAVSMGCSDKQTLAARKLLYAIIVIQLLSFISTGLAMAQLPLQDLSSPACTFGTFWWGPFDSSKAAPATFWLYYTFRLSGWLHSVWLGLHYMELYNEAEWVDCSGTRRDKKLEPGQSSSSSGKESSVSHNEVELHDLSSIGRRKTSQMEAGAIEDSSATHQRGRPVNKNTYNLMPATTFTQYLQHCPTIVTS